MTGKNRPRLVAAILMPITFAACAATGGGFPNDAVAVATPLLLEGPPIYSLLGFRGELNLTSEQITALDSIALATRDENRELIAELRAVDGDRNRNGGTIVVSEHGRPFLEAIRENHGKAVAAVSALLDDRQRAEVCEISARPDQQRSRGGQQGPGAPRPSEREPAPTPPDSLDERTRLSRPVSWDWCPPPGARDSRGDSDTSGR